MFDCVLMVMSEQATTIHIHMDIKMLRIYQVINTSQEIRGVY